MSDRATVALQAIYDERRELTAEIVVKIATDPDHPLHAEFEWDDSAAAEQYRLEQARSLIRRVTIVLEDHPVRAFPFLQSRDSYVPLTEVLADTNWRNEMLRDFEREAERFARKWRTHKFVAARFVIWLDEQRGEAS